MQHDHSLPLVDQLAAAALASRDDMTRSLFTIVRSTLDDHIEKFFLDPTSENLSALVGFWTRAVKLLKDTPESTGPDVASGTEAG